MRVTVITESFLPQVNGVTNSVLRVCEQMRRHGNPTQVIAPGPGPKSYAGATVVRAPSVALPGYRDFQVGRPWPGLAAALRAFRPDVVHLASPAALGAQGAWTARRLGIPVVAVYQTDLASFARSYGIRGAESAVWRYLRRVHRNASCTLAPSRHAVAELHRNGIERVRHWARGVDTRVFSPRHRDEQWRAGLVAPGETLVGYVGRLGPEKEVELLGGLRGLPGVRVVVVGDGPQRVDLERRLPGVTFLGHQSGAALSRAFASLDLFVHTGSSETFCQAAQEALASGVPVVAPAAGGLLDLVEPWTSGLLFAPGDPGHLRTQVEALTRDEEARRRMGWQARGSVRSRSWNVIGDQLIGHYVAAVEDAAPTWEVAA